MNYYSMNNVTDYLLAIKQAEIPKRKSKSLKNQFDNKKCRYNKDTPISKVLDKKLTSVSNTNEFKSFKFKTFFKERLNKAMKKHVIKNKLTIREQQSAFKNYANSYKLANRHFMGEAGLSMIQYQKDKETNISAEGIFHHISRDLEGKPEVSQILRSLRATRFNIHNEDGLHKALEQSVELMLLHIEDIEMRQSGLNFIKTTSITIHYDRYGPTRAGSCTDLPDWIKSKKACVNFQNKDNKCFKYCIQSVVFDKTNKPNSHDMYHYNKLKDNILNWDCVNSPAGNRDIARFEETNKGLVSINVYEIGEVLKEDKKAIERRNKVRDAKYEINLLKLQEGNDCHHVVVKRIVAY